MINVFWCLVLAHLLIANQKVQAIAETSTAVAPRCLREDSKKCVIVTLHESDPSQEVVLPALSGKSMLQIKRGNLNAFSEKLANQLGTVEKLQLGPLGIKKIFIKPELLELTAGGNRIDAIEFPPVNSQFKLQILDLSENRLKNFAGFEVLVNLRELHLEANALESVDLNVFKSMTLLEKLFLDRNQITTVKAVEPFELPVLEYLSLSGNQIEQLDVTKWQLDSLTKLDVSTNKLATFEGNLQDRFPSLQTISVAKNRWHCKWLEDTLQQLNESYVKVQDRDEGCEGIPPANICCVPEHSIDPANDQRLNELEKLEKAHEDFRAKVDSKFGNLKTDNEKKLNDLESRLKRLEELENKKPADPETGDDSMKSRFQSLEQDVKGVESSFKKEQQLKAKQQKDNDIAQRKLGYTILELRRSLERDTKQIAELQAQFESLRNLVRKTLENRDILMK